MSRCQRLPGLNELTTTHLFQMLQFHFILNKEFVKIFSYIFLSHHISDNSSSTFIALRYIKINFVNYFIFLYLHIPYFILVSTH